MSKVILTTHLLWVYFIRFSISNGYLVRRIIWVGIKSRSWSRRIRGLLSASWRGEFQNISTCSMINAINVPKNKDSSYLFQRVFLHLKSWSIYYLFSALPLTHLRHGTGSDKMWHSHYGMLLPRYQTDQTKYKKQVLVLKHISL